MRVERELLSDRPRTPGRLGQHSRPYIVSFVKNRLLTLVHSVELHRAFR